MRGSCLCGGVTFELTEPFVRVSLCHCTTCKAITWRCRHRDRSRAYELVNVLTGRELVTTYQPAEGLAKSFAACADRT